MKTAASWRIETRLVIALVLAGLLATTTPAAQAQTFVDATEPCTLNCIIGTVVAGDQPFGGVIVEVSSFNLTGPYTTTTADDGTFNIPQVDGVGSMTVMSPDGATDIPLFVLSFDGVDASDPNAFNVALPPFMTVDVTVEGQFSTDPGPYNAEIFAPNQPLSTDERVFSDGWAARVPVIDGAAAVPAFLTDARFETPVFVAIRSESRPISGLRWTGQQSMTISIEGPPRNWYLDLDEDGFGGRDGVPVLSDRMPTAGGSWALDAVDCDDNDPAVFPGAIEVPNDGINNNCDPATPDVLCSGDCVTGSVFAGDEPLSGIRVDFSGIAGVGRVYEAVTDENGEYTVNRPTTIALAVLTSAFAGSDVPEFELFVDDFDPSLPGAFDIVLPPIVDVAITATGLDTAPSDNYNASSFEPFRAEDVANADVSGGLWVAESGVVDGQATLPIFLTEGRYDSLDPIFIGVDGANADASGFVRWTGQSEITVNVQGPLRDWYPDVDLDGFGQAGSTPISSIDEPEVEPFRWARDAIDCNDNAREVFPGATEIIRDGVDNDCDPTTLDAPCVVDCVTGSVFAGDEPLSGVRVSFEGYDFIVVDDDGNFRDAYGSVITDENGQYTVRRPTVIDYANFDSWNNPEIPIFDFEGLFDPNAPGAFDIVLPPIVDVDVTVTGLGTDPSGTYRAFVLRSNIADLPGSELAPFWGAEVVVVDGHATVPMFVVDSRYDSTDPIFVWVEDHSRERSGETRWTGQSEITVNVQGPLRDWYPDVDLDGFGEAGSTPISSIDEPQVEPFRWARDAIDCDDTDLNVFPGAIEVTADGVDNDCDPETGLETGDVNCDDRLTIGDALVVVQYSASNRTNSPDCASLDPVNQLRAERADVNNDGAVNIGDALLLAQCAASVANVACPRD